jgi:hypothetical protein
LEDFQADVKNKFAATSWMNSLGGSGGGNSTELMRFANEQQEEA